MAQLLADEYKLCLQERYQNLQWIGITDESPYGVSTELRGDKARYLVGAKMDDNQKLTFFTIDNPTPLETLSWTPANPGDDGIRLFYFNILAYSGVTNYKATVLDADGKITVYPHIIFTGAGTTVKLYRCKADIVDVEPEVTVGWEDYWEIYDYINLSEYVENDKLLIHIHDDLISATYESCLRDDLDEVGDDILHGVCESNEEFLTLLKKQTLLDSANSLNWNDKSHHAGYVIKEAYKKFCC